MQNSETVISLPTEINLILNYIKENGPRTFQHMQDIAFMVKKTSFALEDILHEHDITPEDLYIGALLHDIGKVIDLPSFENEHNKIDRYTQISHPEYGGYLLSKHYGDNHIYTRVAREHHEKYDGSGYYQGLKDFGTEPSKIHPASAIIGIIDSIHAGTTRTYNPHKTIPIIIKELSEQEPHKQSPILNYHLTSIYGEAIKETTPVVEQYRTIHNRVA